MNVRTNTPLYKNISLTLYSRKGWCFLCVRGELETETDFWPKVLLTIAALLSYLVRAAQPWVTEGPSPSVWSWFSLWNLVPNWLQLQLELTQAVCCTWLYNCLKYTCFCRSSAYLHGCISWLMARSRVNISHGFSVNFGFKKWWEILRLHFIRYIFGMMELGRIFEVFKSGCIYDYIYEYNDYPHHWSHGKRQLFIFYHPIHLQKYILKHF